MKLWKDVLDYLNIDKSLGKVRPELQKYYNPLNQSFCQEPTILSGISLPSKQKIAKAFLVNIKGSEKFNTLQQEHIQISICQRIRVGLSNHFQPGLHTLENFRL